jgi:hypothetical protein
MAGRGIRKKLIDALHKWRHRIMVNEIRQIRLNERTLGGGVTEEEREMYL